MASESCSPWCDEERARLISIINGLEAAVIEITPDLKIARWNPRAEIIYGFTEEEAVGQSISLLIPPESTRQARVLVQGVIRTGKPTHYEGRRKRKDGEMIDVHVDLIPVYDNACKCVGIAAVSHDVTQQRKVERELQDSQLHLRTLFQTSVDPMVVLTRDLAITEVNDQAARLLGKEPKDLLATRFESYFADCERAEDSIKRAIAEGSVENYELRLKGDGKNRPVPVSVNASVFRDAAGNIGGVFAIVRDVSKRMELERRLEQAQSYTRGLIESSIDAMVVVDTNLVISDVNEQMARLAEAPRSTLIGSRFDGYFKDRERACAGVRETLAQGVVTNYDLTLQQPGGTERLVSFNASVFRDSLGAVQGIFAVARDVTEQRHVESQLREQQLYGRSLIEASNEALFAVDPQGKIIDVNEQSCKMTGCTRGDLIGSPFVSLFTDIDRSQAAIEQTLRDGFVQDYDLILTTFQGSQIPVSFNASLFRGADGRVKGIFAAAREVTERRRQQDEHALLASIVAFSEDAIYAEAPDLTITHWNKAAERLFGYSAQEMIGRNAVITVPLRQRAEMMRVLRQLRETGEPVQYDTVRLRKDGTLVDVAIDAAPMRDQDGKITGFAVTARDIGERKRIERELVQARDSALEAGRLKSEFLANMSHEIRTPLNSIIATTELLTDTALSDDQRDLLRDVEKSGEALLSVINDVLDFSKISVGKLSFDKIDFDLLDCVEGCTEIIGEGARSKNLDLIVTIDDDAPRELHGDPARLRQVLLNLLSNAVKFTAKGDVRLRVSKIAESETDAVVRFEVTDTGIGIPQDAQKLLFQPFSQITSGTSHHPGGTGLGLAIAANLVRNMEGKIGVTSVPGAGSTFWFTVKLEKPVGATALEAPQPHAAVPPPSIDETTRAADSGQTTAEADAAKSLRRRRNARVRILVAEDNAMNLKVALRQLAKLGYAADGVVNGREVIEACGRTPYDIILMDCLMPVIDGYETTREIRRLEGQTRHTKIIAMTANALEGDRTKCLDAGMDSYLSKPLRLETLEKTLTRVAGSAPTDTSARSHDAPAAVSTPSASRNGVNGKASEPSAGSPEPSIAGKGSALDPEAIARLREEGDDFLSDLIDISNAEMSTNLQSLEKSLASGDHRNAMLAAHSLKGTAVTFGAKRMQTLAAEIEQSVRAGSVEDARGQLDLFCAECVRVRDALIAEQRHGS